MSVWSATGEVKRWFKGDNSFEGLNMGIYGRYGEYDILLPEYLNETEGDWRQGENYGGGLSLGYTVKISKKSPLYFDFGAYVGYDRLIYDVYYEYRGEEDCNAFKYHVERDSYGLKRLKASILWRF